MIWGRSIIAAILARLERRFGFPELHARQAALVELSDRILAKTERLDADLADRTDHLGVRVSQLAEFAQRLDDQMGVRFAAMDKRVETEVSLLADQTRQLGGHVQGLDSAVVGGFAAVDRRLETDHASLADQARQLGDRTAQLFESVQRLDEAATVGFATIGARLTADQVNLADQGRRLDEQVSGLAELVRGLGGDVGRVFTAIGDRLETGFAGAANQNRHLADRMQQLSHLVEALDSDVRGGFADISNRLEQDLRILASQIRQLGENVTQLAAFMQNLDQNVAQNFASSGRRLDADLVAIAKTTHDLLESSRHAAGTLARLAADQIELGDTARRNNAAARSQSVLIDAAHDESALLRFDAAGLPASIRKSIAASGFASRLPIWRLDPKRLPQTPEALPQWLGIMAASRAALKPGEQLVWAQPIEADALLSESEVEQTLGLVGAIDGIFEAKDRSRTWRIAMATRRIEGAGVALRWSLPALEALHIRLRPLIDAMLRRLTLGKAAHAIDLPEPGADLSEWARLLPSLLATIGRQDDLRIGVTLPNRFDEAPDATDDALARLRQTLRDSGCGEEIAFQWMRGSAPIARSSAVLAFARRHGIRFDLTPVSRRTPESRLAAYDDRAPYQALDFDLRLPLFGSGQPAVIETARWSGRAAEIELARGGKQGRLVDFFEEDFARGADRLARVLDRVGQRQFELQVNLDAALIDYWPSYFVHNWAPPAPAWLRMFEFDAAELFAAGSPLIRLCGADGIDDADPRFLTGARFFDAVAKSVPRALPGQDTRQLQIDAHGYLSERRAITADAERLIAWMPEQLGVTLELGSGMGVMAQRARHRASRYIGVDLTLHQALAVRAAGADGLVGDINRLPFAQWSFDTIIADNVVEHAADPLLVLRECRRVLKPGGQAFFIIPPDYAAPEFSNRAHLWKADADSVREALRRAAFRIVRQENVRLADLGVSGAYPSSDGQTGLWHAISEFSPQDELKRETHGDYPFE